MPIKKTQPLILILFTLFCIIPSTASAQNTVTHGYFVLQGTTLTRYLGTETNVNIPDNLGITRIGGDTFNYSNASNVRSVTIPNGVTTINDRAFISTSITTIRIPASVTFIGQEALSICPTLNNIIVSEQNIRYSSIEGILFDKYQTELIRYPSGKTQQTYTIPNGVASIANYAFMNNKNLRRVNIPTTVARIGQAAFMDCESITTINIPIGVTTIELATFYSCKNLTNITIPTSVTYISRNAFNDTGLNTITIPSNVSGIQDYAFANTPLRTITISRKTLLGTNVFPRTAQIRYSD
jgi:hypothetical protein